MADWEAELAALLRTLDVSLERDAASASPPAATAMPAGASEPPVGTNPITLPRDHPIPDDEVIAVRQEIEATLARVIHLTAAGRLDRTLRDDVVFVLHALTRPGPPAMLPAEHDEWQLASAAAVLHFCRVITRLTQPRTPDSEA